MNSILKKSLSCIMVFCLMFLFLGLSVRVNAETSTFEVLPTDFNSSSYAANNGEHTKDGVVFFTNQMYLNSNVIQ